MNDTEIVNYKELEPDMIEVDRTKLRRATQNVQRAMIFLRDRFEVKAFEELKNAEEILHPIVWG